jgi:glycerol-3-phosphate acyltransferase PlsX
MTRIALDAMGGDNAPGEIVRGGVEAALGLDDVKVILVGVQSQIEAELAKYPKEAPEAISKGRLEMLQKVSFVLM